MVRAKAVLITDNVSVRARQHRGSMTLRSLVLWALLCPLTAQAAISLHLAKNADNTRTTAYPNGDKPIVSCTSPSGWTEESIGNGGGEICSQSASEFDLNVSGTTNMQNMHMVWQDAGSGDVQLVARITNTYAGSAEPFAAVGIQLREASSTNSYTVSCHSPQNGSAAIQMMYGSSGSYTSLDGGAGQSRPHYVALTYDVSSGDLKCHASSDGITYTEVGSTNRVMSDVIAVVYGQSKSATETLQATIDNIALGSAINVYTPVDPTPSAPTLDTAIANQNAVSGTAFSLSIASNFSGESSYTATGFPALGGFTFNTSTGAVGGTPDSDDVSASPFNVTFCGVNAAGSTCDVAQFTVTAPSSSGDIFLISAASGSSVLTLDCSNTTATSGVTWTSLLTQGSGNKPGPGDTIEIDTGTRTSTLELDNCTGADGNRITVRNKATGQVTFRVNSTSGNFRFMCNNCINVDLKGQAWSGAPSGQCGINESTLAEGKTQCGIVFETDYNGVGTPSGANGANCPQAWVKWKGTSSKWSVQNIEIDSEGCQSGSDVGVGIDGNDHAIDYVDSTPGNGDPSDGCCWREDISAKHNYIHGFGASSKGECTYLGPNAPTGDWPWRRIEVSYNLLEDCARDAINGKFWLQGPNLVHHNHVRRSGSGNPNDGGQQGAINITSGGDVSIYSNIVEEGGRTAIECKQIAADINDPDIGPYYCYVYNNLIINPGKNFADGNGIAITRGSRNPPTNPVTPVLVYHNTIVDNAGTGTGITRQQNAGGDNNSGSCIERDNIIAGFGTAVSNCSGLTGTDTTGTVAAQHFVNGPADPGTDDYHLTSTSPACNAGTSDTTPSVDYEDGPRPLDSHSDDGADEAALCPSN